jgi:hypothetical protein
VVRWLSRGKQEELWDEVIQWPIGDLEAARKIREICNAAAGSAEKSDGRLGGAPTKANKQETERYQRAAKTAMEIAIRISDDLLRDSAVSQIVALCVKASDLRTASILVRAVQAEAIKEDVLNKYPSLRHSA